MDINKLFNSAQENFRLGNYPESKKIVRRILRKSNSNIEAINFLAMLEIYLNNREDAIKHFNNSLSLNSNQPQILFNLGICYFELDRLDKSLDCFKKCLNMDYKNPSLYINIGRVYFNKRDFEQSEKNYCEALKYDETNKNASMNLAYLYNYQGKYLEASKIYERLLNDHDDSFDIYYNLGIAYDNLKEFKKAINCYLSAIELDKDNYKAYFNLSCLYLNQKRFTEGWNLYDYRWNILNKNITNKIPECTNINSPNEKILIWGEQGIGDQIIYSSMLGSLPRENNLTIALDQRLVPIFRRSFDFLNFISFEEVKELNINFFDSQLALGSLGKFYRRNLEDFKNLPRFFLKADLNRSKKIRENLKIKNKKICGISWKNKNEEVGFAKSLKLEDMVDLLSMDDFTFVDLQYGDTDAEKNLLKEKFDININAIEGLDKFNDIDGLLSLIEACDLIVTSSNVTAHLAGAIGKKTFLMAPESLGSLWYWHDDKQSIWYQSVTLYRKKISVGWEHVVKKIIKDIH